jgi:TonB-dependent SusC/RagA subfamily outer membrane receptor
MPATSLSPARRSALAVLLLTAAAGCGTPTNNPEPVQPDRELATNGRPVEDLFAGKWPGVEVARAAGGGITVRIRAGSTILAGTEPIYIIDGARVQSGPGGLLFLDPGDIQKIEVLKDIGSTAMYGSEGANGVVIITTKRAR